MTYVGFECSAAPASVALWRDGKLLGEFFCNVAVTHSQTLLPMFDALLESCNVGIDEIDGYCISSGPGSFTGIRIGISAVKGLAAAKSLPCVGVSTLLGIANGVLPYEGPIAAVMDARCDQFYCALFLSDGEKIIRIFDDMALSRAELCGKITEVSAKYDKKVLLAGDGATVFYKGFKSDELPPARLAPESCRYQSARAVITAACPSFENGNTVMPKELLPVYLRLPQAQRELKAGRENQKAGNKAE